MTNISYDGALISITYPGIERGIPRAEVRAAYRRQHRLLRMARHPEDCACRGHTEDVLTIPLRRTYWADFGIAFDLAATEPSQ